MKKIYRIILKVKNRIIVYLQKRIELKKIKEKKRVDIQNSISLTKKQEQDIQSFYKHHYGKKIKLNWHKNYYAISKKFSYKYFPEILFIPGFERLANSPSYYKCMQDKNILDLFINGLDFIKTAGTIIRCSNYLITDSYYNIISFKDCLSILNRIDMFFIKPSIGSNSGKGCRICIPDSNIDKKTGEKIIDILKSYGKDFVIQKVVKNSDSLRKLNPTSVNTFRIITYILEGQVYHMPILLRIGRSNTFVDNAHAGGIFIGVTDDGYLLDTAHSEFGDSYNMHPDTNVEFKDYYIKEVPNIIEAAHKLQSLLPYIGCINWDLTINENNEIVLIEGNMRGGSIWLPQMAHGKPCFEDNTERILEIVKNNTELY